MPPINQCLPACSSTPITVSVPGPTGTTGTTGANAFTVTTSSFVVPAVASTVTVPVVETSFMAVGQYLYVTDGTSKSIFQVSSIGSLTSVTLTYIADPINTQAGNTMGSNAAVTPAGFNGGPPVTTPISIANGGTAATTKAGAQTALGLGQSSIVSTAATLTQVITTSFVQIGANSAVAPSAGKYLVTGFFGVDWAGVTFSASRVISGKARNTVQLVDYGIANIDTQILTTATFPTSHYVIPPMVATLAANDAVQMLITINTANTAGTLTCIVGSICLTPLALT